MEHTPRASPGGRALAALNRDPAQAPHALRNDVVLTGALMVLSTLLGLAVRDGSRPDALGWALLLGGQVPLIRRRTRPLAALSVMIAFIGPYHALGYTHFAPIPGSMIMLYTVAATGRARRTVLTGVAVIGGTVCANLATGGDDPLNTLRIAGWIVAVLIAGANVRVWRRLVIATVERAERAERTREEEAARRVAEERLRIARDLHDLLAHSITLIGVRASVAAHLLTADPDRFDRAGLAKTLDDIADTCRDARAEVRTTLEVLRHGDGGGPLPDLTSLPDLVGAAGADLTLDTGSEVPIPPAVAAAAYRIVQEALTNSVRHAGPDARAAVTVRTRDGALHVTVTDEGRPTANTSGSGFGLIGLRERARSVGGTLLAGPRQPGGFEVAAVLPLHARTTPLEGHA
ncbi:histidine kinase [Embleya sp. NBC_00896]|uniref:sensor histidine kinase n=1 Tax=Embleya sp. NBC_00896 TaxID=2975961 RepID=UPI002F9111F2